MYILCWLSTQVSFFLFLKLFKSNYFILVAALEPKKWKLRAHSLENIARQEMEKGKLHLLKLMHSFQVKTLSKNNNNLICMNPSRCMKTFQLLKRDYATLRRKLEAYFQVGRISLLLSHFKLILIYILRYTNIYIYINQKRFIDVVLSFVNINCISWQGKLDPMRLLVAPSNQSIRNQYTYIWYWQRTVMGAAMWSIVIDESLYCVCVCVILSFSSFVCYWCISDSLSFLNENVSQVLLCMGWFVIYIYIINYKYLRKWFYPTSDARGLISPLYL